MGKQDKKQDRKQDKATAISKKLAFLLRHGAAEAGLRMRADGFVRLSEVLACRGLHGVSVQKVKEIVAANDKQRFALAVEHGETFIRANQGHTLTGLQDDALLTEIRDAADAPVCIHGTYRRCIAPILRGGLSRMARNHVHCAALLPEEGVVSGMRGSCEVAVYVDVGKSMALGLKWYRSANGVLLTPGDEAGLVPPSCFEKVIDLATGERIPMTGTMQGAQTLDKVAKKMEKGSFFEAADDAPPKLDKRNVKKMKPAQLKGELKLRGLSIQGNAKELVTRLTEAAC